MFEFAGVLDDVERWDIDGSVGLLGAAQKCKKEKRATKFCRQLVDDVRTYIESTIDMQDKAWEEYF